MFSILVAYSSGSGVRRFNVQTDMSWEAFRVEAGIRMGVRQDTGLAYRQFYTITVRDGLNDLSGCYGPVLPLLEAEDWERAMTDLRKAGEGLLDVEIELLAADTEVRSSCDWPNNLVLFAKRITSDRNSERGGGRTHTCRWSADQDLLFRIPSGRLFNRSAALQPA